MTAFGNLIAWQKVEYDFDFHKTDFPANVTVLVLSEGKSLLPVSWIFVTHSVKMRLFCAHGQN